MTELQTPRALAEVACTLFMTGTEVQILCETHEEAEELFDWLEAQVGRSNTRARAGGGG